MNKIVRLGHRGTGAERLDIFYQRCCPTIPATSYKDPPMIVVKGDTNVQKRNYPNREH